MFITTLVTAAVLTILGHKLKFKTLSGQVRRASNIKKYLIKWDCPSRSKFQFGIKQFLEPFWYRHVVFEEFPIPGSKLSLDFFNANMKIAIEVQGAQHTNYVPYFHGNNKINYLNQLDRDVKKKSFCDMNDIHLVEVFSNDRVDKSFFEKHGIQL